MGAHRYHDPQDFDEALQAHRDQGSRLLEKYFPLNDVAQALEIVRLLPVHWRNKCRRYGFPYSGDLVGGATASQDRQVFAGGSGDQRIERRTVNYPGVGTLIEQRCGALFNCGHEELGRSAAFCTGRYARSDLMSQRSCRALVVPSLC